MYPTITFIINGSPKEIECVVKFLTDRDGNECSEEMLSPKKALGLKVLGSFDIQPDIKLYYLCATSIDAKEYFRYFAETFFCVNMYYYQVFSGELLAFCSENGKYREFVLTDDLDKHKIETENPLISKLLMTYGNVSVETFLRWYGKGLSHPYKEYPCTCRPNDKYCASCVGPGLLILQPKVSRPVPRFNSEVLVFKSDLNSIEQYIKTNTIQTTLSLQTLLFREDSLAAVKLLQNAKYQCLGRKNDINVLIIAAKIGKLEEFKILKNLMPSWLPTEPDFFGRIPEQFLT